MNYFDWRYAARRLVRSPVLTASIILILAVTLGLSLVLLTVVHRALVRPLPYPSLSRLVVVWESLPARGVDTSYVAPSNFLDWRERATSFSEIAAIAGSPIELRREQHLEQTQGAYVTDSFFDLVGVRPVLGRLFTAAELESGERRLAVIAHSLYRRLASDSEVLGASLYLGGEAYVVIGVLPEGGGYPREAEIWLPTRFEHGPMSRARRSVQVLGRLSSGVTLARAQAEMDGIAAQLQQEHPAQNAGANVRLESLRQSLSGGLRPLLTLLTVALGLVVVIVLVNVSNSILAQTARASLEASIHLALGANRRRLVAWQIATATQLALVAAGLGWILAAFLCRVLESTGLWVSLGIPTPRLDGTSVAMAAILLLATTIVVALPPAAIHLRTGPDSLGMLAGSARGHRGLALPKLQRSLVSLQLAVSLPLLVTSLLLLSNLRQIRNLDLGLTPAEVTVFDASMMRNAAPGPNERSRIVAQGLATVRALPAVASAGAISDLPLSGSSTNGNFVVEGRTFARGQLPTADFRVVTDGYLTTMKIPVVQGRGIHAEDHRHAPGVALINESLAKELWPDQDPLQQTIWTRAPEEIALFGEPIPRRIIGVVGDVLHHGPRLQGRGEIYVPFAQNPVSFISVVVRSQVPGEGLSRELTESFRADAGGHFQVSATRSMNQVVSGALGNPDLQTLAVVTLAVLSSLLVLIGVYGVVSHFLVSNLQALAVRAAIGASPWQLASLIWRQALGLWTLGIALGILASAALARLLATQLDLLEDHIFLSTAVGVILLLGLCSLATMIPLRKALLQPPGAILSHE